MPPMMTATILPTTIILPTRWNVAADSANARGNARVPRIVKTANIVASSNTVMTVTVAIATATMAITIAPVTIVATIAMVVAAGHAIKETVIEKCFSNVSVGSVFTL